MYQDTLKLEQQWREGKLDDVILLDKRERQIIEMQPRDASSVAIMASDGLFDLGASGNGEESQESKSEKPESARTKITIANEKETDKQSMPPSEQKIN